MGAKGVAQKTHYKGCEREHHECALARLNEARDREDELYEVAYLAARRLRERADDIDRAADEAFALLEQYDKHFGDT